MRNAAATPRAYLNAITRKQQVWTISLVLAMSSLGVWLSGDHQGSPLTRMMSFRPLGTASPYCTRQDISDGWWEETDRFNTSEEIPAAYGYQVSGLVSID